MHTLGVDLPPFRVSVWPSFFSCLVLQASIYSSCLGWPTIVEKAARRRRWVGRASQQNRPPHRVARVLHFPVFFFLLTFCLFFFSIFVFQLIASANIWGLFVASGENKVVQHRSSGAVAPFSRMCWQNPYQIRLYLGANFSCPFFSFSALFFFLFIIR